jgi:hypothetical protein
VHGQQLLAHDRDDRPGAVLELDGLPESQRLAVGEEDPVSLLVGDSEIVTDREELLLHRVTHVRPPLRPLLNRPISFIS